MDILAKRLVRIAENLSEEAEEDFYYEYGISVYDYEEAKRNPIYGFLLYNGMTADTWIYCADSREQVIDIRDKVVSAIRNNDEVEESGELVKRPSGVELASLVFGNLFYVDEDKEYVAEIDGEYRLVDVISRFSERF